jgi:hypothetical protein
LNVAFQRIRKEGFGVVIYGIDQDARGLGIASHYSIYDLRQNENLDTEAVFEKLDAKLDNRDYTAVAKILRYLNIQKIKLLSNNAKRLAFLQENGFAVEREILEAPLDRYNMATMMLEKEDLGYQWSFKTHAEWLIPIQASVEDQPHLSGGRIVVNNTNVIAEWVGEGWDVAKHLRESVDDEMVKNQSCVAYLTDYPRIDELKAYFAMNITLIVMPYTEFPNYLVAEAKKYGIKLQDWARENRYSSERPQWHYVGLENMQHVYEKNGARYTIALG